MDNHALEQYKAKQANAAVNTVVPERGMIDPFDGDISALDMVVIVVFVMLALFAVAKIIKGSGSTEKDKKQ